MKIRKPLAGALFLVLLGLGPAGARADWDPANTCAVIVGVLTWQSQGVQSFSARHRKDQELYDTLLRRGVPRENMTLLLDREATLANVRRAVRTTAERAKPRGLFLFYYAGHGERLEDGSTALLNYDAGAAGGKTPAFAVTELGTLLRRHFKGGEVLLLADCCHSGGLKEPARSLAAAGFKAASLTSADAPTLSTENWTFTQTVLDGLNGDPAADADGDGSVTLGEVAAEVAAAMEYRERQRSGFAAEGLPPDYKLAPADRTRKAPGPIPGGFLLKEYVLAQDGRENHPGRILAWRDGKYAVEFYDYSDKRTVMLPASALAKIKFETHRPGETVTVLRDGRPLRATVVEVEGDFQRVTYADRPALWDEWVLSDRIVTTPPEAPTTVQVERKGAWRPAVILEADGEKYQVRYQSGDGADEWVGKERIRSAVSVRWGGAWWPGLILEAKGDEYRVHYPGWGSEWDEWATKERLRFAVPTGTRTADVERDGTLWQAVVLRSNGDRLFVHYLGWGADRDEWVGKDRVYLFPP
jgi:hypothetical protein